MSSQAVERPTIGGVSVPPMAIGTWSWGDEVWGHKEEDMANIREAWDAGNAEGLTFYDTAEVYGEGKSESIIGELIRGTDEKTRSQLYIATKYLPFPRPAHVFFFSPGIISACQKSLKRLGVKSIDLYLVHAPGGIHSFAAEAKQLAYVYKQGWVKAIGVSNFSKEELIKMYDLLAGYDVPLVSNQVEFSLLRLLPETSGLLAEMKKRNMTCLAYSPLGMGRLTGKYSASNPVPKGRKFGSQYTWEQLDPLIADMKVLAEKYGVTVSAIALNWVISKGAIPLGGARNAKQAKENAKATTFRLTSAEVDQLSAKGLEGKTTWNWQHG